jgi:tetratricopeptide (TPR) repeat protein
LTGDEEPSDVQKFLELRQALLMNLSLSTFKQGEFRLALNSLDQLLAAQSNHIKALFVKAKCLNHLGETREAIEFFTRCNELDKTNMV